MTPGVVVGLVLDNADPEGMHRVQVEFPHLDRVESSWCRMITPMAGEERGLVLLPEAGSEVIVGFLYRSSQPVILGAVYNGTDDTPDPYDNSDGDNKTRTLWTRGDNMLVFQDGSGEEALGIGSKASTAGDVTSGGAYDHADAAGSTLTHGAGSGITWEAGGTVSISCGGDFKVTATGNAELSATMEAVCKGTQQGTVDGTAALTLTAATVHINGGAPGQTSQPLSALSANHPPET